MRLLGEGHSGRGISKGQDLEGRAGPEGQGSARRPGGRSGVRSGRADGVCLPGKGRRQDLGFALSDAGALAGP